MGATSNGTAEVWRQRIIAQRASGQSIRAWCRVNSQHEHAFYWWRSRLGLSPRSATQPRQRRAAKPIEFTEVVMHHAERPGLVAPEPMCLRLCGGRELILPASMPVEQIAKLIHAIEVSA
jgi:hypothetical protein